MKGDNFQVLLQHLIFFRKKEEEQEWEEEEEEDKKKEWERDEGEDWMRQSMTKIRIKRWRRSSWCFSGI